jgi:hypothetical protein
VKQGPDQTNMLFGTCIVTYCKGNDITDNNKRMFFTIKLHPEICAAICKDRNYLTFDICLKAGVEVETALHLNAEYNKAFKSVPKGQASGKAGNDKGKGKARHDFGKGRILQGVL